VTSIRVLKTPKRGEKYYYIGCSLGLFSVKEEIFADDTTDQLRLKHYNMFEFSRDAEKVLKEVTKIFEDIGGNKF
jgi:hypothetical protein